MRAARFYGQRDIRVEDVPVPEAQDGKLQVDVEWCGICGSDLHEYVIGPGMLPTKPHRITGVQIPVTIGHELCGRVRSPPAGSAFQDGDAVTVDPRVVCRSCLACKVGSSYCCERLVYVGGSTGFGGFGERVLIEEKMLLRLPPEVPLQYAALLEPLAVVWHAIKRTEIKDWKGIDVLVLGGGPIGMALLLCLKACGADRAIVSEPAAIRREQVAEFASTVLNPIEDDVSKRCIELTNGVGVGVVFDCAGVPAGLEAGFEALKFEGLYLMVALYEKPVVIPCVKFLAKHITMRGTFIMGDGDFADVLQMMAEGKLTGFEKMVTARIDLKDIVSKGFEELVNNKDKHIKILVKPT